MTSVIRMPLAWHPWLLCKNKKRRKCDWKDGIPKFFLILDKELLAIFRKVSTLFAHVDETFLSETPAFLSR